MKFKKIFSIKRAMELVNMGNPLLFSEENHSREGFKVFAFAETEKFLEDLTKVLTK